MRLPTSLRGVASLYASHQAVKLTTRKSRYIQTSPDQALVIGTFAMKNLTSKSYNQAVTFFLPTYRLLLIAFHCSEIKGQNALPPRLSFSKSL